MLKGTGFNRVDLTTNLNVIPTNRLNVDLRFYLSLTNRKKKFRESNGRFSNQYERGCYSR